MRKTETGGIGPNPASFDEPKPKGMRHPVVAQRVKGSLPATDEDRKVGAGVFPKGKQALVLNAGVDLRITPVVWKRAWNTHFNPSTK